MTKSQLKKYLHIDQIYQLKHKADSEFTMKILIDFLLIQSIKDLLENTRDFKMDKKNQMLIL